MATFWATVEIGGLYRTGSVPPWRYGLYSTVRAAPGSPFSKPVGRLSGSHCHAFALVRPTDSRDAVHDFEIKLKQLESHSHTLAIALI